MGYRERADAANDRLTDLYIAHIAKKHELEWHTVSCILSDPLAGREKVRPLGLDCSHFEDEDLRLIYAAVLVAAERGRDVVVYLAMRALEIAGSLNRNWPEGKNSRWTLQSLAYLACHYPSVAQAEQFATQLIDLRRRGDEARRCWKRIAELLRNDAMPMRGMVVAPTRTPLKRRES